LEDSEVSATIEMPVQEFAKWFEKETVNIVKPLDKEASGLIDEVKKRINQAKEDCDKLIKECEREIEKGKAYHRSRVAKRLALFSIDTLNKINFPEPVSFENTETLLKDLKKTYNTIQRERNVWFPRISPLFILARRKIDMTFARFFDAVEKLDAFTQEKYAKVKSVSDGFATARTIMELQNELEKIGKEENETKSAIASINKQIEETRQKIAAIEQKDEMKELLEINQQIHELRRKIKYELRYVQKPFIKLQNLYHSGDANIPLEEIEKVGEYLSQPFLAFASEEQGYPLLKKILRKINESIEHDKLKLKSSRLRKAQDQIESILKAESLIPLQQQCQQVYARRKQLLTSNIIANFQNESTDLKKALKEHQRQMDHLNSKLSNIESNHKEKKDKLERHKTELEKTVFAVTKKNVRLDARV
jgi:predicted  nucleic acid-binding Zn-ribbon protein